MIYKGSLLKVIDNSGAKTALCIGMFGGRSVSTVGDVIKVSVKSSLPQGKISKGSVCNAVIVRVKKYINGIGGSMVKFDDNAIVIVNSQNEMIGTRVNGVVSELLKKKGFNKLISLARGGV